MAKNKKPQQQDQPAEPKGFVASIADAVDKVLHPEHAADQASEKSQAEKDAEETHADESETDPVPPSEPVESSMQDHKKFDKFNGGIS